MCYNVQIKSKIGQYENRFQAKVGQPTLFNSGSEISGFTFPKLPVIREPGKIEMLSWGLIPHWSKDESIRKNTLNARVETLTEKPSFQNVTTQRCLVLIDGFYEWQWLTNSGSKKQKYYINSSSNEPFALGGLWSSWSNGKSTMDTFTIITAQAQGIMKEIHNSKCRMPFVLSVYDEKRWISNTRLSEITIDHQRLVGAKIGGHGTLSLF